jgi:hypothetical protein
MMERYRRWAAEAWVRTQSDGPGPFSPAYACGFKEGFVDYLDAGGSGEPPPLPPRKYWSAGYETAAGQAAIRDWFAGFRHGAAVAGQSGARRCTTVPSSTMVAYASGRFPPAQGAPTFTPTPGPAESIPPAAELVPAPAADAPLPPTPGPQSGGAGTPPSNSSPWPGNRTYRTAVPEDPIAPLPPDAR